MSSMTNTKNRERQRDREGETDRDRQTVIEERWGDGRGKERGERERTGNDTRLWNLKIHP